MIKEKESSRGRNGFTLVELLAVIVILAIILVIAVPKVMSVIEDSKKATLESTAKMIASAAEKQKIQNTVLGKTEEITCDSVAKINKGDYDTCNIEFDNNTAKVTIEGKGKFEGLYVCGGTKTNSEAKEEECEDNSCIIGYTTSEYVIDDVEKCANFIVSTHNYADEYYSITQARNDCTSVENVYFSCHVDAIPVDDIDGDYDSDIHDFIEYNTDDIEEFTRSEPKDVCITEETSKNCFEYNRVYSINDVDACVSYTKDPYKDKSEEMEFSFDESHVRYLCEGNEDEEGWEIISDLKDFIRQGYFTEEELIENNVITLGNEIEITGYDETCGTDVVVPNMIDGYPVVRINSLSNSKIRSISFGSNIMEINCSVAQSYLEFVKINNTNTEIRRCAFGDISLLKKYNIPDTYVCD